VLPKSVGLNLPQLSIAFTIMISTSHFMISSTMRYSGGQSILF